MKFLLTNDDGVDAPGLACLAQAVAGLGEVIVVAPREHCSGCSHQATTGRPLALRQLRNGWYCLDGSPVDCTRVGLTHLAPGVDWVLSGVNEGGNLGADVYLSGTVAAAREACLMGRPAVALSQYVRRAAVDWDFATEVARLALQQVLTRPAVLGRFWNVNIPHGGAGNALPDFVDCPLDPHPLPIRYQALDGKLHYHADYHHRPRHAEHDVEVCFSGRVAISELRLL